MGDIPVLLATLNAKPVDSQNCAGTLRKKEKGKFDFLIFDFLIWVKVSNQKIKDQIFKDQKSNPMAK